MFARPERYNADASARAERMALHRRCGAYRPTAPGSMYMTSQR